MLASILNNIYIDDEWVAREYMKRCKDGTWKKENTRDARKCWNLERVIQAELMGQEAPEDESFDAFVQNSDMLDGSLRQRLFLLGVAT